jgi:ABC-type branched-subunit amino acid transport system substrate-binding protein
VLRPPRALASSGVACLAALAIAGCSANSSSSSKSALTITGHTLSIYLSEPSDLRSNQVAQDIVHAEQMAFSAHSKEVSDFKLALVQVGGVVGKTLSDNARSAIIDQSTIAYLGEIAPGTSDQTAGITNAQDVLQVSPTDNALELSNNTPAVSGGFKSYFEDWSTYGRTFARVVPSGIEEARAQAAEMKSLGVKSLYVANDGSDYGRAIADAVAGDAKADGISAAQSLTGAAATFYGAQSPAAAAKFFNHVASTAPSTKLFGPSSLNTSSFSAAISGSVHNLYVSIPGYLPKDLPAAGKAFDTDFKTAYHHTPNVEAIFGFEAMSALLRVLASEGNKANERTSVVNGFINQRKVSSVLGTYSINSSGNTSLDAFVFARMSGGELVPFVAAPLG